MVESLNNMTYEIVVTVLDERIAELCSKNIEKKTGYHCEIRKHEMTHEPIQKDGECYYRDIAFEQHNGRYMVVSNSDLLDLGICTPKTIQRGHKGYKSLATLMKRIDKGLGD